MAITRTQQARQMLKDGNFVMQGGVKNYLGEQKTVSDVPLKWQSGPDKPSTELAYITEAEKKLLLKEDIHGSLKDGPNEGPEGIMSLDSAGDKDGPVGGYSGADVSAAESGNTPSGMSASDAAGFRAGALSAGAGAKDTDTDAIKKEAEEIQKAVEKRKKEAKAAITKEEKKEARLNYKKIQDRLKKDRLARQQRIEDILSGKIKNFGLTDVELADLKAAGLYDEEEGFTDPQLTSSSLYGGLPESVASLFEKSDKFSGAEMEAFKEKFNLPDAPGLLGLGLKLFEPLLKKGSRYTKDFFTDDVLGAGKFTYKGQVVTPEMFKFFSPTEMQEVYGDYMDRRMGGDIDAYGNPIMRQDDGGSDPILPLPMNQDPTDPTDPVDPRSNFYGLTPRIAGSIFDFSGLANGGRAGMMDGGMMDDNPTGGIMDLETGRQMYFLGKLVKKATRAVKKIVKSPIGKAALLYGVGAMGGSFGAGKGLFSKGMFNPGNIGRGLFGISAKGQALRGFPELAAKKGLFGKLGLTGGYGGLMPTVKGGITLAGILPFLLKGDDEDKFDIEEYYRTGKIANVPLNKRIAGSEFYSPAAEGGLMRAGYQEGGDAEPVAKKTMPLIDMDGKEKDYRETGGFVDMGRMERADDVPARLSKNEFVFTADAVRNAGDGDIDKGAEVMYNMMKNLEDGGDVSEESQGLEGARNMFQTSQRLGEVL